MVIACVIFASCKGLLRLKLVTGVSVQELPALSTYCAKPLITPKHNTWSSLAQPGLRSIDELH